MNRRRAAKKLIVVNPNTISKCSAQVTIHVNRQMYTFCRGRCSSFTYNGPATGLLQAGAKRDDLFPLRGRETSLLRRESDGQARPLLRGFLQPGRTVPPELVPTEGVQGAAAAELVSRIARGGTMSPLGWFSQAEDFLHAVRHEGFPPSWVALDPTEDNATVASTGGSVKGRLNSLSIYAFRRSHQLEPWEAQSLDRNDAGLGEAESHLLGPVQGLHHHICHGAIHCFGGIVENV
ncbi:hypothetical protein T01_2807 [Trichinella spiralis]|uniref:Uncharacterized protein n=1 Tax=Trichinella spiralis TaxID=6334 RepID=A0A0V1BTS6_TRISP|nr:hypothetical protein T01_2807 [Trichinella spiralis]